MAKNEDTLVLNDKVSEALNKINKNIETFDKKIKDASVRMDSFQKKTENISKLGNQLSTIGSAMTVGVTLPTIAIGEAMLKAAANTATMEEKLGKMFGSELEGAKMFDEIKQIAAKTPFETGDLVAASETMLGLGVEQKKLLPLMKQLGDISGGNANSFSSLAEAFSQVSLAGRLQEQDLNQMVSAGFNPLEEMAKNTGKSMSQLKDDMNNGAISTKMVEDAMTSATDASGRFYQGMEKHSKTALGQFDIFIKNTNQLLADLGKIILPTAIKALQDLNEIILKINNLSPGMKKLVIAIGLFVAILGPIVMLVGGIISAIAGLSTAIGVLSAVTGIFGITMGAALGWIIAIPIAIAAIIAVIVLLWKNWDTIWNAIKTTTINIIQSITGFLDELIEKLGIVAYMIPGLAQYKIGKNLAGAVQGNTNNNIRQSSTSTTNNSTRTTNNFYNNNRFGDTSILGGVLTASSNVPQFAS